MQIAVRTNIGEEILSDYETKFIDYTALTKQRVNIWNRSLTKFKQEFI